MRQPLNGAPRISSIHGGSAPGSKFGKHLGIDRLVPVGTNVYAPGTGAIRMVTTGSSGGKQIEARIGNHDWRFLHLSEILVRPGQTIKEGQLIAKSGNTGITSGPHLHYDARKAGTSWSDSFNNYVDPDVLIYNSNSSNIPSPTGGSFRVKPGHTFRIYKPGTTTVLAQLTIADGWYKKRGKDSKYPNRWLAHSSRYGMFAFPYANTTMQVYKGEFEEV